MPQPRYDGQDFKNQINHLKRASNSVKLVKKWIDAMPHHKMTVMLSEHFQRIIAVLDDTIETFQNMAADPN